MVYPDESRLYAGIYLHAGKLYILEATVPQGAPPPILYQQSLGWVDANGNEIRYRTIGDAPTVVNKPDPR